MLRHFVNLVAQAVTDMPSRIGSNWGGVIFSLILFVLAEVFLIFRQGHKWKQNWLKNALWGLAPVALGWIALFAILFVTTIYDDHQNLVGAAKRIKSDLRKQLEKTRTNEEITKEALANQITELQKSCAVKEAVNQTVQRQNRDEQLLIANCQQQAIKLLVPPQPKVTQVALYHSGPDEHGFRKATCILLTNKSITPIGLTASCWSITDPITMTGFRAFVMGGVEQLNLATSGEQLANHVWRLNIGSPAWTDTSPVLVEVAYTGTTEKIVCAFGVNTTMLPAK